MNNINEEINVLQREKSLNKRDQDDIESNTSNARRDSFNARIESKRYLDIKLTYVTKRRSVKLKNLDDYHDKSRREHRD